MQLYLPWTLADTPVVAQPSDDNSGELETTTLEEVSASPDNEIDPDNALAHYNLAITYYNERIYSLAIRHCDKAIELGYQVPLDFLRALEPHRKEAG